MGKRIELVTCARRDAPECVYSTSFRCSEETVKHLSKVREYMDNHGIRVASTSDVIRFSVRMGYIYACKLAAENGDDLLDA